MTARISAMGRRLRRLTRDAGGQMTVEWALVLVAIALPMFVVIRTCLRLLVAHFQMMSGMITLPFP